jgi:hypothetical protein
MKPGRRYVYLILSVLISFILSWVSWSFLNDGLKAEYPSMTNVILSFEIFIASACASLLALYFYEDKFLKTKTTWFYIFCSTLNLVIGLTFILFRFIKTGSNFPVLFYTAVLFFLGIRMYIKIFSKSYTK